MDVNTPDRTGRINADGLDVYYEGYGAGPGRPLVILHGGFMSSAALGPLPAALAVDRPVIAFDLEGHGRTRDLDRPLGADQMGRDVGAAIRALGLGPVDLIGFSMGGAAAQRTAFHHPDLVRRLVLISTSYSNDGFQPGITAMWPSMSAEGFKGTPMEGLYAQTAPEPDRWPVFVDKMKQMMIGFEGWPKSDLQAIKAPVLLMLGDADLIRLDHAVEMFGLLGGGQGSGMGGASPSRLAVLPGVTHFDILYRLDLLSPMIQPFLAEA